MTLTTMQWIVMVVAMLIVMVNGMYMIRISKREGWKFLAFIQITFISTFILALFMIIDVQNQEIKRQGDKALYRPIPAHDTLYYKIK